MRLLERGIAVLEGLIERLGRGRDDLHGSLGHAVSRANDLADECHRLQDRIDVLEKENQDLQDQIGHLRFNGPTLYSDEIEVLREIVLKDILDLEQVGTSRRRDRIETIRRLLQRCDLAPVPAGRIEELAAMVLRKPPEHDDPPPGFAPCTRLWPHDGPCAHPPYGHPSSWCLCPECRGLTDGNQ